jgi:hypothetical protein
MTQIPLALRHAIGRTASIRRAVAVALPVAVISLTGAQAGFAATSSATAEQKREALGANIVTAAQQIGRDPQAQPQPAVPELQAFAEKAYRADFDVTKEEAAAALDEQRRGEDIETVLHEALGGKYLGARYDNEQGRWLVAVTGDADRKAVRDYASSRNLADLEILVRDWTGEDRQDALKGLRSRLSDLVDEGRVQVFDARTRVQVDVVAGDDEAMEQAQSVVADLKGIDTAVVRSAVKSFTARPSAQCNNIWCNPPLRAGERMVRQSAGGFCTVGFPATTPVNTWNGFALTAGHCVAPGNTVAKCTLTSCWVPLGNEYASYYGGGGDGGLLILDHNYPTYGAWWPPQWAESLPTRAGVLPAVGTQVCHSGTNTFGGVDETVVSCANVISNDTGPITYVGGTVVNHMISLGNSAGFCTASGNSGGPVVTGSTAAAVGLYSASNGPGTGQRVCGATYYGIAEPVLNAQAVLGVTIKTS